jgi:hypothetical protein
MRVRDAVRSTLAVLPLLAASCTSPGSPSDSNDDLGRDCGSRSPFEIDQPLTAATLDSMVPPPGGEAAWAQLACEQVCFRVHLERGGHGETDPKQCALTLPVGDNQGHISCSGTTQTLCKGRRPLAHVELALAIESSIGEHLAAMAYLEAASVLAFEELAVQLARFGAPQALIDRCLRAAADERRHARSLSRFAEQHGAVVTRPAPARELATPLEVALHNAVEGCVHESFAALLEALLADRAEDPRLRRAFVRIAADELEHGELAWDIHAWLLGLLDARGTELVLAAQRRALERLPITARAMASTPRALGGLEAELSERIAGHFAARLAA